MSNMTKIYIVYEERYTVNFLKMLLFELFHCIIEGSLCLDNNYTRYISLNAFASVHKFPPGHGRSPGHVPLAFSLF